MPKVLIFKETLLPPSETFILAQMRALTQNQPRLFGLEPVQPSLPLPQDAVLLSQRATRIASLRAQLYRRTGVAPRFHRRARDFHPDLIHAHFASGGRSALHLAHALRIPLVVTLHGSDVTVRAKGDVYSQLAEEAALFLCVSRFIRERAIEAGFPAEKLVALSIGIDLDLFSPVRTMPAANRVLFVGRLVEKKGCEYLLRAMEIVQQRHPSCELVVIGDGPLRSSLESLAKLLKVHCDFRGVQSGELVRAALRSARIFCLPSVTAANGDSEGLPTVIAEAQAMGLPVVSTTHAGIPELVIDQATGLLAPERDYEALAEAICVLLTDEEKWHRLSGAAVARMQQHFHLQTQTGLLEELYSRVSSPH